MDSPLRSAEQGAERCTAVVAAAEVGAQLPAADIGHSFGKRAVGSCNQKEVDRCMEAVLVREGEDGSSEDPGRSSGEAVESMTERAEVDRTTMAVACRELVPAVQVVVDRKRCPMKRAAIRQPVEVKSATHILNAACLIQSVVSWRHRGGRRCLTIPTARRTRRQRWARRIATLCQFTLMPITYLSYHCPGRMNLACRHAEPARIVRREEEARSVPEQEAHISRAVADRIADWALGRLLSDRRDDCHRCHDQVAVYALLCTVSSTSLRGEKRTRQRQVRARPTQSGEQSVRPDDVARP